MAEPAAILRVLNVHHGHPDEVIESLRADPALFPFASYFLPVVQSERSSLDQSLRRLRTLAEIIAPALRWRTGFEFMPLDINLTVRALYRIGSTRINA